MAVVQLVVEWRTNEWVLLKDAVQYAESPSKAHILEVAAALSKQAGLEGYDCEMLVRDRDGEWRDEPCPDETSAAT